MACKMICDGCGKTEDAIQMNGEYVKPSSWYQRTYKNKYVLLACSQGCFDAAEESINGRKEGK
jgi:hypothetical protein